MRILLKDGIKYLPYKYKDEDELERMVMEHSESIFGADSVLFPKRKIQARSGIASIPDGFILLINDKQWYILEVELASHSLFEHIVVQLNKFNSAIKNPSTRKKLIDAFYYEVENDIQTKYKFEFNKVMKELYKFLSDTINKDPEVTVVVNERTSQLDEVCQSLPFRTNVLVLETYYRDKIGVGVHIHSLDALKDYEIKEDKPLQEGEKEAEETAPVGKTRVEITLRGIGARKYALIPITQISKGHRSFFPGYKEPFTLMTDIGEIRTKVTSAPKGTAYGDPQAGNYIQGGLKPWWRRHSDLKEGDRLVIEELEPKKKYRLNVESPGKR